MPTAVPGRITVTASGTPAGGVSPHFRVLLDGQKIGEGIAGAVPKDFTFTSNILSATPHTVQIHYDNDAKIGTQDRNLKVSAVKVNDKVMLPADPGVTYDRFALDNRDVIPGQTDMLWNGALKFSAPASLFPDPGVPPAPPTSPGPSPMPNAYYASPQGRDGWSGKLAAPNASLTDGPVASLGKAAQLARDDPTTDTVIMRGGTYQHSTVTLLGADSGLKIKAFGDEKPILNGNQTFMMMQLVGANNVTITDLTFTNGRKDGFAIAASNSDGNRIGNNKFENIGTAIKLYDASGNLIANNEVSHAGGFGIEMATRSDNNKIYKNFIHHVGETNPNAAGIAGHGSSNNTVAYNNIEHTARYGVSFKDFNTGEPGLNNAILSNRIEHTNKSGGDTGGIEFLGRSNLAHNHRAEGNFIDDTGGFIRESGIGSAGVYLDDMTNNTTVRGNFIRGTTWTDVMVHGGDNNRIENNFMIMRPDERAGTISNNGNIPTGSVATGNTFQKNVIYSDASVPQPWVLNNTGSNTIDYNLLHNIPKAPGQDAHSLTANPMFWHPGGANPAGGDYSLQPGSPARNLGITDLDWSHMGTKGWDAGTSAAHAMPNFWDF